MTDNELQVNIRRVVEGNVDLYRNTSQIKTSIGLMQSKLDMNEIFITHHDTETKKLKVI